MYFKKFLAVFLSCAVLLPLITLYHNTTTASALSPLDSDYSFAGSVTQVALDSTGKNLLVSGTIKTDVVSSIKSISVYVVEIYKNETLLDFSHMKAVYTQSDGITNSFSYSIPVTQLGDVDSQYGNVFTSKIAVVITKNNGSSQLVDFAKYLGNPGVTALNKEPLTRKKSVKGVGVLIPSDLEQLGVQYTTINVCLWALMTMTDHGTNSVPYEFEGKTYYFVKSQIQMMDNTLTNASKNDMAVLGILIMNNSANNDVDSPAKYMVHPDAQPATNLVAINTTDSVGIQYYKALMSFLSMRYSRADNQYGHFEGYIVGNEIGASSAWNYMGQKTLNEYADEYTRWLRLTNTVVKQAWSSARVYSSFDCGWTKDDYGDDGFVGFANRDILNAISKVAKLQGDFDWNVAWHPYPQDIFKIDTWNDPDALDSFDTKVVTFKNLQVLPEYLSQSYLLYNGTKRHVILSEEGFTSSDNSKANQTLQAAAYAYAYYKAISVPGIDFFSMNGNIDNEQEMGLHLGLWTAKPGSTNTAYKQKVVYNVFKNIDTVNSLQVSKFALDVIGQTMGKTITDWKQVIPEFDPAIIAQKCNRPGTMTVPGGDFTNLTGANVISQGSTARWEATDDTENLTLKQDATTGEKYPMVSLMSALYDNQPKDYKGMTYTPAEPLNLTATPVLKIDAMTTGVPSGQADLLIRAYNGDNIAESTSLTIPAGQWGSIAVDFSGWSGISSVSKIKVWVRPHADETYDSTQTCTLAVNNLTVAKSVDISGVGVTTDVDSVSKVGDVVNVTVQNKSNKTLNDNASVFGTNGLVTDISNKAISIAPGQSLTFPVTVTGLDVPMLKAGTLNVKVAGQAFSFALTTPVCPDYVWNKSAGANGEDSVDLGQFENGFNDGWGPGMNADRAYVVTESYEGQHLNPPAAAKGTYFLNIQRGAYNCIVPAYATKTFMNPVNLSGYKDLHLSFYGYGGASTDGYSITVELTAVDGTKYTVPSFVPEVYQQPIKDTPNYSQMTPDQQAAALKPVMDKYDPTKYNPDDKGAWAEYYFDISGFPLRKALQSISISYSGNNAQAFQGGWQGWFAIDDIYAYDGSGDPGKVDLTGLNTNGSGTDTNNNTNNSSTALIPTSTNNSSNPFTGQTGFTTSVVALLAVLSGGYVLVMNKNRKRNKK